MKPLRFCFGALCVLGLSLPLFAQQRLSLEQGLSVPIHKESPYKTAYYISPKFELDDVVISYSYQPVVADSINPTGNIDLHTLDLSYRLEVGVEKIRPYFMLGGGYAFYNAPTTFLNGAHFLGVFGINYILEKYFLVLGPVIRYNAVLFDSEEKIVAGDSFRFHQFISFLFNVGYTF
jgi:hypothetical protein